MCEGGPENNDLHSYNTLSLRTLKPKKKRAILKTILYEL